MRRRFKANIIKKIMAKNYVQVGNFITLCVYLQKEELNNIMPVLDVVKFVVISSNGINKIKNKIAKTQDTKIDFNNSVENLELKLIDDT